MNLPLTLVRASSQRVGDGGSLRRGCCGSNGEFAFLFMTTGLTGTLRVVASSTGAVRRLDEGPQYGGYRPHPPIERQLQSRR